MTLKELEKKQKEASCGIDDFDVLVYIEDKGFFEIKDVTFLKSSEGYLAVTIKLGDKSKNV